MHKDRWIPPDDERLVQRVAIQDKMMHKIFLEIPIHGASFTRHCN